MWSPPCIPCKVSSCLGNLHPYTCTGYQKTYTGHPHLVVYPILVQSKAKAFLTEEEGSGQRGVTVHTQAYMGRGEGPNRGHITVV